METVPDLYFGKVTIDDDVAALLLHVAILAKVGNSWYDPNLPDLAALADNTWDRWCCGDRDSETLDDVIVIIDYLRDRVQVGELLGSTVYDCFRERLDRTVVAFGRQYQGD